MNIQKYTSAQNYEMHMQKAFISEADNSKRIYFYLGFAAHFIGEGNGNLNKAYWALKKVFSEEVKKSPPKEEKQKAKEKRKDIPI